MYFSLPEWFHPDYLPYGQASMTGWDSPAPGYLERIAWPGGLAHLVSGPNVAECCRLRASLRRVMTTLSKAYNTSGYEPYTGYVPVSDYIEDLQKPQFQSLFYKYDTEILW